MRRLNLPKVCIGGSVWQYDSSIPHHAEACEMADDEYSRGGWVIKWRIGLSACINGGCNSVGDFAQYRISLFVHATLIPTCLLKWMQQTKGTIKNCQRKRLT
jgi:hypothetical protein